MTRQADSKRRVPVFVLPGLPADTDTKVAWCLPDATANSALDPAAIAVAVESALDDPSGFPSIGLAIVPGDTVAMAACPFVPGLAAIVRATAAYLKNYSTGDLQVVLAAETTDETRDRLIDDIGDTAKVVRHDGGCRDQLRYLIADSEGLPVYFNRHLVDADLVIPIIASQTSESANKKPVPSVHESVFPTFADVGTRIRQHDLRRRKSKGQRSSGGSMTPGPSLQQQVMWSLGAPFVMQVSATRDGAPAKIVVSSLENFDASGEGSSAAEDAIETFTASQTELRPADLAKADLVIASIDGHQDVQTWQNIVRAGVAASRHLDDDGTIVIWSAVRSSPSEGLREDWSGVERSINEDGFPEIDDSNFWATKLADLLQRYRVVLHSELPEEMVEDLGIGVVADSSQLGRLVSGFDEVGIIRCAHLDG